MKDSCTTLLHLKINDEATSEEYEHILTAYPEKQRESTITKFDLAWKIYDGEFTCGNLVEMEATPLSRLIKACVESYEEKGEWPGKDELIKSKDRHGLTQNMAKSCLDQAIKDNLLCINIGRHNRHEIQKTDYQRNFL